MVVVDPVVFDNLHEHFEEALGHAELAIARDEDDYIPWEQIRATLALT